MQQRFWEKMQRFCVTKAQQCRLTSHSQRSMDMLGGACGGSAECIYSIKGGDLECRGKQADRYLAAASLRSRNTNHLRTEVNICKWRGKVYCNLPFFSLCLTGHEWKS